MERFAESEAQLRKAHTVQGGALGDDPDQTVEAVNRLVFLYESWHAAELSADHAAKWHATLPTDGELDLIRQLALSGALLVGRSLCSIPTL